ILSSVVTVPAEAKAKHPYHPAVDPVPGSGYSSSGKAVFMLKPPDSDSIPHPNGNGSGGADSGIQIERKSNGVAVDPHRLSGDSRAFQSQPPSQAADQRTAYNNHHRQKSVPPPPHNPQPPSHTHHHSYQAPPPSYPYSQPRSSAIITPPNGS